MSIRDLELESWQDYALVPWSLLRYGFAWLYAALIWYPARRVQIRWPYRIPFLPRYDGRDVDPDPIWCDRCGWAGMRRWAIHAYAAVGDDDVEPCDECPRCAAEI